MMINNKKAIGTLGIILIGIIVLIFVLGLIVTYVKSPAASLFQEEKPTNPVTGVLSEMFKLSHGLVNGASDFMFGVDAKEGFQILVGYHTGAKGWGNWFVKLFIGLVAGILIWLGRAIIILFPNPLEKFFFARRYEDLQLGEGEYSGFNKEARDRMLTRLDLKEGGMTTWLSFIGGNWSNILILGVVYATLMQMAFISRILEIITLYPFTPWFLRPLVLAIIVGYAPSLIHSYIRSRMEARAAQTVMQAQASMKIMKAMSQ